MQFNPQTLKVNYQNQKAGDDQQGSAGVQYVGKGSTTLSVDLLFDVTRPTGSEDQLEGVTDVRDLTRPVNLFMRDLEEGETEGEYIPPGVRFVWGSFLFEGVMNSMSETLEFFDPEGRPLRATVSISLSQQEIQFGRNQDFTPQGPSPVAETGREGAGGPEERPPGAESAEPTSVQQTAGEQGRQDDWKRIAEDQDIENPRGIYNPSALSI